MNSSVIPVNKFSRPGEKREKTLAIVVHWPQAPGWTAQQIRNYFARAHLEKKYRSTHDAIGLDGEIVEIIPRDEIAYHCGTTQLDPDSGKMYTDLARELFGLEYTTGKKTPNYVTIGVEVAHTDIDGTPTAKALWALEKYLIALCWEYRLEPMRSIIRHYDVVGWKDCPRYFVEQPEQWRLLKTRVQVAYDLRKASRIGKDEHIEERR